MSLRMFCNLCPRNVPLRNRSLTVTARKRRIRAATVREAVCVRRLGALSVVRGLLREYGCCIRRTNTHVQHQHRAANGKSGHQAERDRSLRSLLRRKHAATKPLPHGRGSETPDPSRDREEAVCVRRLGALSVVHGCSENTDAVSAAPTRMFSTSTEPRMERAVIRPNGTALCRSRLRRKHAATKPLPHGHGSETGRIRAATVRKRCASDAWERYLSFAAAQRIRMLYPPHQHACSAPAPSREWKERSSGRTGPLSVVRGSVLWSKGSHFHGLGASDIPVP